jgi:hypothetical protein
LLSDLLLEESADINPPGRSYGTAFARPPLGEERTKEKTPNTYKPGLNSSPQAPDYSYILNTF